jgi:hypothetical protein
LSTAPRGQFPVFAACPHAEYVIACQSKPILADCCQRLPITPP